MMRRVESEIIGSLFWIAVGIFFALNGLKLDLGTLRNPGPGFLPLIMAVLLVLFALFVLGKALIKPVRPIGEVPWKRPALMIASVFLYISLFDFIGFLFSNFILMSILFSLLIGGKSKWVRVFVCAAATALGAWVIFSVVLGVPFPAGRLMTTWR